MRVELITDDNALAVAIDELARVEVLALDTEGNGMHAFRPRLCTLQLCSGDAVAVIDALAIGGLAPLAPILGADGPLKILHDLTFDARMLADQGIVLGNVRDTSVAARFLGEQATGLASLLRTRLGVELDKGLQGHDWAERPLTPDAIEYLAGDVRHLMALDASLQSDAERTNIAAEIAVECAYKLDSALAPPRERRPPPARVKGYRNLHPVEQAILHRLWFERDRLAELADRPPHRMGPTSVLVALARARPTSVGALRRAAGSSLQGEPKGWLAAVQQGLEDGAPPALPVPPSLDARTIALRKHLDGALARWRKDEARLRQIDAQVVMPGHCMARVIDVLAKVIEPSVALERLRGIEGICAGRIDRYGAALVALAERAHSAAGVTPPEPPE